MSLNYRSLVQESNPILCEIIICIVFISMLLLIEYNQKHCGCAGSISSGFLSPVCHFSGNNCMESVILM